MTSSPTNSTDAPSELTPASATEAETPPEAVVANPQSGDSGAELELLAMQMRRKTYPILGPGILVYAALLWAFVVAGESTTAGFVGEGIAITGVVVITGGMAALAIRACRDDSPCKRSLLTHVVLTALVTLLMSSVTALSLAVGLQSKSGNLDIPITLFLLLLSGIALAWGQRLMGRPLKWPASKPARVALGGIAIVLSFIAVVHVVAGN